MQIKYNIIPKHKVTVCRESNTLAESLAILEQSGYRCVPILSDDEKVFKGNIYAQVVYRALWKNDAAESDNIMKLAEDSDVSIEETASFFRIFSSIKKYPYLPVQDEDGLFSGILTHANVMAILEDSWGVAQGNYTLTVSTHEYQGALSSIMTSIKRFTPIHSMMTLDNDSTFFRRVIITLPKEIQAETLKKMIAQLEGDGFRVFDVEKI
ncbi:cyclic di-AMP binding protein CbpA [Alkalicoccus daliensis]|uniref:CBS domain-containing protein n=1 Tax=Alkalicoccus daliensis TaxID=745820 RepID=A0A1H0ARL7_9BACI|nr:cyclic di-AMP binding protein CbpA [Alkalicoccus daliensis]SDN36117.1 hypothetical protein SAMN04488053_101589 [Alkalicoccus daliensis]